MSSQTYRSSVIAVYFQSVMKVVDYVPCREISDHQVSKDQWENLEWESKETRFDIIHLSRVSGTFEQRYVRISRCVMNNK